VPEHPHIEIFLRILKIFIFICGVPSANYNFNKIFIRFIIYYVQTKINWV